MLLHPVLPISSALRVCFNCERDYGNFCCHFFKFFFILSGFSCFRNLHCFKIFISYFKDCCHLHHQICGCFLTTEDTPVPCRAQKCSTDTCCLAMLNKASLYICDYCRTCYFLPNAHHPVYI